MNLNFSQEEITFQEEVRDFLRRELTPDLVNAAKQTSAARCGKPYLYGKNP